MKQSCYLLSSMMKNLISLFMLSFLLLHTGCKHNENSSGSIKQVPREAPAPGFKRVEITPSICSLWNTSSTYFSIDIPDSAKVEMPQKRFYSAAILHNPYYLHCSQVVDSIYEQVTIMPYTLQYGGFPRHVGELEASLKHYRLNFHWGRIDSIGTTKANKIVTIKKRSGVSFDVEYYATDSATNKEYRYVGKWLFIAPYRNHKRYHKGFAITAIRRFPKESETVASDSIFHNGLSGSILSSLHTPYDDYRDSRLPTESVWQHSMKNAISYCFHQQPTGVYIMGVDNTYSKDKHHLKRYNKIVQYCYSEEFRDAYLPPFTEIGDIKLNLNHKKQKIQGWIELSRVTLNPNAVPIQYTLIVEEVKGKIVPMGKLRSHSLEHKEAPRTAIEIKGYFRDNSITWKPPYSY